MKEWKEKIEEGEYNGIRIYFPVDSASTRFTRRYILVISPRTSTKINQSTTIKTNRNCVEEIVKSVHFSLRLSLQGQSAKLYGGEKRNKNVKRISL